MTKATPKRPTAKKAAPKKNTQRELLDEPGEIDATAFKKLARERAAAPKRLLARIDQFASMGRWTVLPGVSSKGGWQPSTRLVVVAGDVTAGKLVVHDGASDFGVVIVLGVVTCASLDVKAGWTFVCTGALTAKGTVTAIASDSATYVGGNVTAKLVKSGTGAWLTLFGGAAALKAPVSSYVMVDGAGVLKG